MQRGSNKRVKTVAARVAQDKEKLLEHIRKVPILQVACERASIGRSTVYRWKNDDPVFAKALEDAMAEGEAMVNDMGESQLISLIREKNWSAISFWLRHRNPKFRERVEVTATVQSAQEALSPEQEEIVRRALRLASLDQHDEPTGQPGQPDPGHRDDDAQGPKS